MLAFKIEREYILIQAIGFPVFKITPVNTQSKNVFKNTLERQPEYDTVSFTGKNWPKPDLKELWDKGKLPTVKFGFYGDKLTLRNVTREHLLPKSLGGQKDYSNIVLASRERNMARSNKDINLFADKQTVKTYLQQFEFINLKELNGRKYIQLIKKTLKKLGFDLDKQ